ncbi:hypothetical protein VD0002_g5243 [Verticillium dahliae]|uniref:Uncharacterized protein n=1 Tax=Verticillium dahliae TaxID=27337 RepID=A0AA45AKT3_VERDA|nr:hypothetical protein BJF96_g6396 [Verticillium dahliae]PNH56458.1 hypothetical protein VD0003_g1299 [Verticillium dahliae]PNH62945.1 hypothetical protein VD0002_g5243 [Verticillium dahliae]
MVISSGWGSRNFNAGKLIRDNLDEFYDPWCRTYNAASPKLAQNLATRQSGKA